MRPDDFDDFEEIEHTGADLDEQLVEVRGEIDAHCGKPTPKQKLTIKRMIRTAIKYQNKQVLFTCRECCFYKFLDPKTNAPAHCTLDSKNRLVTSKRMPTQLPDCFIYDPLASYLATILTLMYALGIDKSRRYGWATVTGRLAKLQNNYGYFTLRVTQRNLDKYGS